MAITDIDISETLETNAPSIKYRGNEGPKSPQEEQMMMEQQQMAAIDPMMQKKLKLIEELMSQGYDFGAASNLADKILSGQDEQDIGMAYGGIAGLDGRRRYGIGSKLKRAVRKIIPNEVARVAEVAAPFVAMAAPQFALPAALAGGLGSFDRTGSLGSALKSGAMTYGLGQLSPGLPGVRDMGPQRGIFSRQGALGGKYNVSNLFKSKTAPVIDGSVPVGENYPTPSVDWGVETFPESMVNPEKIVSKNPIAKTLKTMKDFALDNKLLTGLAAGSLGAAALMGNMEPEELQDLQRGEGLDVEGIRAEVIEAFKDPSGEKLAALRSKYPFLGDRSTKNLDLMAEGGRAGFAEGGGIMDLGGMEKDYRNTGGFVDLGAKEKADDVPARLSVNEFVMTADAVRGAGGGDIDKGAEIMENVMENLENGGRISEESQGLKGAQEMFEVSERLSEVV